MTTATCTRLPALDGLRGIAVMGIVLMNVADFALPQAAYLQPQIGGRGGADVTVWAAELVLADGKFRNMFALLFGASMLIVADRAPRGAQRPGRALCADGVAVRVRHRAPLPAVVGRHTPPLRDCRKHCVPAAPPRSARAVRARHRGPRGRSAAAGRHGMVAVVASGGRGRTRRGGRRRRPMASGCRRAASEPCRPRARDRAVSRQLWRHPTPPADRAAAVAARHVRDRRARNARADAVRHGGAAQRLPDRRMERCRISSHRNRRICARLAGDGGARGVVRALELRSARLRDRPVRAVAAGARRADVSRMPQC